MDRVDYWMVTVYGNYPVGSEDPTARLYRYKMYGRALLHFNMAQMQGLTVAIQPITDFTRGGEVLEACDV